MKLVVIGGGFVGVTTGVVFAEWRHEVFLVEQDTQRREALEAGRLPFYEEGLAPALKEVFEKGDLRVVPSLEAVDEAEAVFLCVGTPSLADGSADLSQLESASEQVAMWGKAGLVVVKSTVPPGTTTSVVAPRVGEKVSVAMNPEFLQEGSAIKNAREPDRVVLGVGDERAETLLRRLYSGVDCPVMVTTPSTAELVKYTANSMLATRIAFANEIASLAERVGVDVDEVMRGVGLDERIGPHFLEAGPGFGGSCFPKDVKALRAVAEGHGIRLGILDAVLANNDSQPLAVVQHLDGLLGGLDGKRVALLGLSFKPGTSDVRETRALLIHEGLKGYGAVVVGHDPQGASEFKQVAPDATIAKTVEEALAGAEACILHTHWPEYRDVKPEVFLTKMARPLVYDTRRFLDAQALIEAGVQVVRLGDGREVPRTVQKAG